MVNTMSADGLMMQGARLSAAMDLAQTQILNLIGANMGPTWDQHGANMGPTWDRQDPGGPHVGHIKVSYLGIVMPN